MDSDSVTARPLPEVGGYRVQHADHNIGPLRMAARMRNVNLLVVDVFATLQGEGPFAGQPAVFIRFAGCNRGRKTDSGCAFCDTAFEFHRGINYSFEQVRELAEAELGRCRAIVAMDDAKFAVLTGGEPMLQPQLAPFIEYMVGKGWRIQIESNGDYLAKGMNAYNEALQSGAVTLVVSPKLNPKTGQYRDLGYQVWDRADYLKVLVDARVETFYDKLPTYTERFALQKGRNRVYLSPIAVYAEAHYYYRGGESASLWDAKLIDKELTRANYQYAAQLCMTHGYSFSMQQHLMMGLA